MSYLSFFLIQYSMGYDDTEIINYVIFGKREELEHFPCGEPFVILGSGDERVKIRPLYLFWDHTDEQILPFLYALTDSGQQGLLGKLRILLGDKRRNVILHHMQNKYREVFLSDPETLFLSEKASAEIPGELFKERPDGDFRLHQLYAKEEVLAVCRSCIGDLSLVFVLPEEFSAETLRDWLLDVERAADVRLADLFLLGSGRQKEYGEEVLEEFYERTGLAGSFYGREDCKKMLSIVSGSSLFVDCFGLPVTEIGRPTFYIDGSGVRTAREIRRLGGVCKGCKSLRNHLDRAFLCAL